MGPRIRFKNCNAKTRKVYFKLGISRMISFWTGKKEEKIKVRFF